jgi:hypothetical protein
MVWDLVSELQVGLALGVKRTDFIVTRSTAEKLEFIERPAQISHQWWRRVWAASRIPFAQLS